MPVITGRNETGQLRIVFDTPLAHYRMILHCSQKLAARLPSVSSAPLEETSPLGSWHAHLFTLDRRQCVMFCHDATRFVLFAAGLRKANFADLDQACFRPLFLSTLSALGCTTAQRRQVELALGPMRFDTATDRSVQGALRVAKSDAEAWVYKSPNVMEIDPLVLSCRLNERPTMARGALVWPDRAMRQLVETLSLDVFANKHSC